MANIKGPQQGAEIGSRQGGAPAASKDTDSIEQGRVHPTRTEWRKLVRDPNLNQSGNERGSADQTQGSQTGNDVDAGPRLPEPE